MTGLAPRTPRLRGLGTALIVFLGFAAPTLGQGESSFDLFPDLLDHAIVSCEELRTAGNSASEGLDTGTAVSGVGHVRSNADVILEGTSLVDGNATAGPGFEVLVEGAAELTGETGVATSTFECQPIDLVALAANLEATHDNALVPLSDKGKTVLQEDGSFELKGNDGVTLEAGTYLFSSLALSGNSEIRLAGRVQILVLGNMTVSGGIHLNGDPFDLRLWNGGGDTPPVVFFDSQSVVHGFVYAPDSAVEMSGQSRLVGGLFARRVTLLGGTRVRRMVDDRPPSLVITAPLDGDLVDTCEIEVNGEVSDAESPVQLTLNGVDVAVAADGQFSSSVSLFTEDPGLIVADATDLSGNVTTVEVRVVIADPTVVLTTPVPGSLVGQSIVTLSGTATAATEVTINGVSAVLADDTFTLQDFDLGDDGIKTLELLASNCGGTTTVTAVLDLDTLSPLVAIDGPEDGSLFGAQPIAVSGTADDAHLESVTVNGVVATVEGNRFTAAAVPLVEGPNSLVAEATDALGRATTSTTVTVELDTTKPGVTITSPTAGALLGTTTVTALGTVTDANLASVAVNGLAATVTGTDFVVADVPLVEGDNTLTATAEDAVGNTAPPFDVIVVRDTLPPELSIDIDALPTLTEADTVTVSGTVREPHLDGVTVNGVVASVVGETFVAADVPLLEGPNSLVAEAVDRLGHATTATAVVEKDTLPPQVTITEPVAAAQLASRTVTVRGTVDDPNLDRVEVLGVLATVTDATFEALGVELPEGEASIVAEAFDVLAHRATSEITVTVDTLAPVVRVDAPAQPIVATPSVTVSGSAQDPHLDQVTIHQATSGETFPATLEGTDFTGDVTLVEGSNEIFARASDTFGHSADSDQVIYVLDTLPPLITIDEPTEGQAITSLLVTVSGSVVDPNLDTVTVQGTETPVDPTTGAFTTTLTLANGNNTIVVSALDLAGNTAEASVSVVLDNEPPAVTLDAPTLLPGACLDGGQLVTLAGAFGDPNPATGLDGQPPALQVAVAPTGNSAVANYVGSLSVDGSRWTVENVDLGAVDGIALITVTATDVIGNVSQISRSFRVDASVPVVTLTLDGVPLAGAGTGDTPPAGTEPLLFGRQLAFAATVLDSKDVAPPAAVLTLDGAPYIAGTPILSEGDHLVVARATDCAGHEGAAHALVRIDLTAPTLLSTNPADGALVGSGVTTYSGTADVDLMTATVDGQAAAVQPGSPASFSLTPFPWREGRNDVTIELADAAGHRSVFARSFTVRSLPPEVTVLESGQPIAQGSLFLRPVTPEVLVSDPTAALTVTLNGAAYVSGTPIATTGSFTLVASATDALGRTASTSVSFSVNVEPPPAITITSPADGTTLSGLTVAVTGTVTGSQPSVSVNGVAATIGGGFWNVDVPLTQDAELVEIVALVVDGVGRQASDAVTVLVATGAPQALILEPADGARTNRAVIDVAGVVLTTSGQLEGTTLTVEGSPVAIAADGSFRVFDVPLAEGTNTLTATVTDGQGQTGSSTVTVVSDRQGPEIAFSADGAPLADGSSFGTGFTLGVEVTDPPGDPNTIDALLLRLNGETLASAPGLNEVTITGDGGYLVSVVARDAAGNETRSERSFVVGLGGCILQGIEPSSGSAVIGDRVTLRGRSTTASAVDVEVSFPDGSTQTFAASLADGTFLAGDVPLPLAGDNTLTLRCRNGATVGDSTSHVIVRLADGEAPTVQITSPTNGALVSSDTIAVSGNLSSGAVTVNGLQAQVTPGSPLMSFVAPTVPLVEGPNVLGARVVDVAGRSGRDRVLVDRDSQAPRLTITSPDNNTRVGIAGSGPAQIRVSGLVNLDDEPHLDSVVVSSALGSVTASVDLASGRFVAEGVPLDPSVDANTPQTLTATATDTLGQSGTATADVLLDAAGPAIVLAGPEDLTTYSESSPPQIAVSGEAWAAEGGRISINGTLLDPTTLSWSEPAADGRRQVAFTASIALPTGDGAFGLIARVTDLDERVAQDRRLLFRDSVAPEVVEIVPEDGAVGVDPNTLLLVLFSEPILHSSLTAVDGLTLTRVATGETVVGTVTVAGNAVGFAPGAGLVAGESYTFRAGLGITDLASHPLALAAQSTFTVVVEPTATAPMVEPLPAVLCTDVLTVTGTAQPGSTLKVRDGTLVLTGVADSMGAFAVSLPVTENGFHLLRVVAEDPLTGARSPETTLVVRIDCSAPMVSEATFDRTTGIVHLRFSEAIDPATLAVGAAGDAIRVSDAEDAAGTPQPGTLTLSGDGLETDIQLDSAAEAFWRDRPVRLQVGPPAADLEGNVLAALFERVFFPGAGGGDLAGGFLFGEAFDDATGRPLEGVRVRLYPSGEPLPGTVAAGSEGLPLASSATEGRGRFTFAGEVPPARYALLLDKEGYTQVLRRLSLSPAIGAVPFDSRLTPLAEPSGTIDAVAGGRVVDGLFALEADAAALPGSGGLDVRLTELSGQGLPDVLPLGWTPAVAVHVELEETQSGEALLDGTAGGSVAGGLRLELPLPSWVQPGDELVAVQVELATGFWRTLEIPAPLTGPAGEALVRVEPLGPGSIAVVVPDAEPSTSPPRPTAAGEVLQGVPRPAMAPALTASLILEPPVIPPTGRSRARVVARSLDDAPWPSGLAVQAFLDERLELAAGGGFLVEAPFSADLQLYHPRLSAAEQDTSAEGAAGALEFIVSPSPRAALVLLDVGFENVRLFPFPEDLERGQVVGPAGGTVGSPEDVELILPESALGVETAAQVELLSQAELLALDPVLGYTTLAAVRVDLDGQTLARPATLRLRAPAATPPAIPGDPRIVVAELVEEPTDFRGSFPKLAAKGVRETTATGERITAGPEQNGALPLEGIVREGLYLVLHADAPIGYATGFVRLANGAPLANARVTTAGLGTADLAALTGRYALPVPAGSTQALEALHPFLDERGSVALPVLAADQVAVLDITIVPVPPTVLSVQPVDGAVDQPLGTQVSVLMSEVIDPSSVGEGTLTLELLDLFGAPTGLLVLGDVSLEPDGVRITFAPERPLVPGRSYLAVFSGTVIDTGGSRYAGPSLEWRFSTSTVVAPGGQVDPSLFRLEVPENGIARIVAGPGAVPTVLAGGTPWSITPEVDGAGDPVLDTFPAGLDGSVDATVGHLPDFPVTIEDRVYVKVFDPQNQLAAHFRVGPFATPDGLGFVAPPGEATTFRTAEGVIVEVPANAFDRATLVTVRNRPTTEYLGPVPNQVAVSAYTEVDFEGEARETLRLSVPAPASVPDNALVFLGTPQRLPWGQRVRLLSVGGVLERDGERFLSIDPSLQPEPDDSAAATSTGLSPRLAQKAGGTCQQVRERGLSQCVVDQVLLQIRQPNQIAWFSTVGADFGGTGFGLISAFATSVGNSIASVYETIDDSWVFVAPPMDSSGGLLLPVLIDAPFTIQQRDAATGWIVGSQQYDPLGVGSDGLAVIVPPFIGATPRPPMLLDAAPFELVRFAAPAAGDTGLIRLEVDANSDANRKMTLQGVAAFPLPDATTLELFDVSPLVPEDPEGDPQAPIRGPRTRVCGDGGSWSSTAFAGSDDMLLVVSPGDLEAADVEKLTFQFDLQLEAIESLPVDQVAVLRDLGPSEGCEATSAVGFPRNVPLEVALDNGATRLVVLPQVSLPAGHRFRLELKEGLLAAGGDPNLGYWSSAPRAFDFATRDVPGETIGSLPEGNLRPAGIPRQATEIARLGNLLYAVMFDGPMFTVDTSDLSADDQFRIHGVNVGSTRSFAFGTDGHNRLFYAGEFAFNWILKAVRLEDLRQGTQPTCDLPSWASPDTVCFNAVDGGVSVARRLEAPALTTSSFLASRGTLPSGNPTEIEVLTQDESGKALPLGQFLDTYTGGSLGDLTSDAEGFYTFDVPLESTFLRGGVEPSLDPGAGPPPSLTFRQFVCSPEEEQYDRYQRVTVDNVTTGQSWSFDIENPWPSDETSTGDGRGTLQGLRARKGDVLQVRYNVRALGYVPILGGGISVVDLNRFYRLSTSGTVDPQQCGRRLGQFEGATAELPSCAPEGAEMEGVRKTLALSVHGETGCDTGSCRGGGSIDLYSPLQAVGALHTYSSEDDPGKVIFDEIAGCLNEIDGQPVRLREVALANDVEYVDRGIRGVLSGVFTPPDEPQSLLRRGDLLFVSLGEPGVFVFDVSRRQVSAATLIGRLHVAGHFITQLQVDERLGLLFAGGRDYSGTTSGPVVDVWNLRFVNGAPGVEAEPQPQAMLRVPWVGDILGIDPTGTGLLYTWDNSRGPVAVPFESPQFGFSGLYLPEDDPPEGQRPEAIQRLTSRFVPLGVPMETTVSAEQDAEQKKENERDGTAAFKLRVALPGFLGEELTAKVQSLRVLPADRFLDQEDVGAAVAPPGGPGWPDSEAVVTLRRLGVGAGEGAPTDVVSGEGGRLSNAYNLYESEETILLLADPRARRDYRRQDLPDGSSEDASLIDEEGQCRRCAYPSYFPDPTDPIEVNDPELEKIVEVLAGGPYLRAFLYAGGDNPAAALNTQRALEFFASQGQNYRAPSGVVEVTAPADMVPSPLQVSLAEPAQNPSMWSLGEAGAEAMLTGGEAVVTHADHVLAGRQLPFSFARTYRSGTLGYGPLGASGWSANLFAHLRENALSGEIEYHDGAGHVWRFYPSGTPELPPGYEEDGSPGAYSVPEGLFLRLQRLPGGGGWRLIDPQHNALYFDQEGRLEAISDRHRRGSAVDEQGNSLRLYYDAFSQLVRVSDDLGRDYRFEYFDDPKASGVDSGKYGLLRRITDFAGRTVEYEWDSERRLVRVELPEVRNEVSDYSQFSYEGVARPSLRYEYDPTSNVTSSESSTVALLHGDFAQLRLGSYFVPQFDGGGNDPRLRLEYASQSGRLTRVSVPRSEPGLGHPPGGGVGWVLDYTTHDADAGPASEVQLTEPWGHRVDYTLTKGRTTEVSELLDVVRPNSMLPETVTQTFDYSDDGRLVVTRAPDGGEQRHCYQDGEGCEAGGGDGLGDRLASLNVVETTFAATTLEGQGTASYTVVSSQASYQEDNLPSQVIDGLSRAIDVPVPMARGNASLSYRTENVGGSFDYDAFGRVNHYTGGDGPEVTASFLPDAMGKSDAGLLGSRDYGGRYSEDFEYDDQFNVKRRTTSFGAEDRIDYDEWDRPVRSTSGLGTDGRLRPVGIGTCELGNIVERAYDAAGHVVRERRLQDYVDESGNLMCRQIEKEYTYNAREQLVSVRQTHLASPTQPGAVVATAQTTHALGYDEFGRLSEQRAQNAIDPALVTTYRYDEASRVAGVRVGEAGELQSGYDENSRTVLRTDGDEGVWRGRYDAWNRLFLEEQPTGLFVLRTFDEAHNPTRETSFDEDPLGASAGGTTLSDVESHFTSFGAVDRVVTVLAADAAGTPLERRVVEQRFDETGRVIDVLSGPALEGTRDLDPDQARREKSVLYELEAGRVLLESFGGVMGAGPEHAYRYFYDPDNRTPWPDQVDHLEAVPGESDLVETYSTRYVRDVMGRPIEERMNDGHLLIRTYDRVGGQPIQVRTGADTVTSMSFDALGRIVRHIRPNDRGSTLYAYDLDGRLRRQVATTQDPLDPWETTYSYDSTGRVVSTQHDDGSVEDVLSYNPDNTPAVMRTREGITLTQTYDAANRLRSVVPSATTLPPTLVPLDAGNFVDYDTLSRPTLLRRGSAAATGADPSLQVAYPSYDLESRPSSEVVGSRSPLEWSYNVFNNPIEVRLPGGVARDAGGAFTGFTRSYDTLDRPVDISALGGQVAPTTMGTTWTWGGSDRLYAATTKGVLQTAARYGYIGGRGVEPPSGGEETTSKWKLGTLTWGSAGTAGPLSAPSTVWGQFGYGWRGVEGDPRDGMKIGRQVLPGANGLDLFTGMGWSWGYDAGVRLSDATAGLGSVSGVPPEADTDRFGFEYGEGDELERLVREVQDEAPVELEHGPHGRILSRGGEIFAYDMVGRRTEDDRFRYLWSWRGELMVATVKDSWPDGVVSPYAGHQIRYDYDAMGRLTFRTHLAELPEGETDDTTRPLIEKRAYVWEGQSLLAEAGYGDLAATQLRWRKTYVPGPTGLDDAMQVIVDVVDLPIGAVQGQHLYTYLRDELGTVVGVVAEDEGTDPTQPPIPVRYLYSPYGASHVERGPELRRAEFAGALVSVDVAGTLVEQAVGDPATQLAGALKLRWSVPLSTDTLAAGLVVERLVGTGWVVVDPADLAVGKRASSGVSTLEIDPGELVVLLRSGWDRGTSYRVRLLTSLEDQAGRPLAEDQSIEWSFPATGEIGSSPESIFAGREFPLRFESTEAAAFTVEGRFPGGQTALFQGLWTDPVTGISYARARWYDARNAAWLSEDPLVDVDSPNLYAFVAWRPNMAVDPMGTENWEIKFNNRMNHQNGGADLGDTAASVAGYGVGQLEGAVGLVVGGIAFVPNEATVGMVETYSAFDRTWASFRQLGFKAAFRTMMEIDREQRKKSKERLLSLPIINTFREGSKVVETYEQEGNFAGGRQLGRTFFSLEGDFSLFYGGWKLFERQPATSLLRDPPPQFVYRGGSKTPRNLTPRASDATGLSTFDTAESAMQRSNKAQVIDTTKLSRLCATCDPPPPGHVSIAPATAEELAEWAATRGTDKVHPLTQEVENAIVGEVRKK